MSVSLCGVGKRFGATTVLSNVDLQVRDGEFLALLGPSGSGKTTLLRVLAGLERADAGQVVIAGQDMAAVPANQRRVGFVFQSYALFRHMSVADNISFGLRVRPAASRPPRAEIARRVEEMLALIQLPNLGGRRPSELSGGQRQRVALARALAIEPQLLLLDEPFGALDAQVRKDLRRWLRQVHERLGTTTVFVTHDQAEAMELADRVAVMQAGSVTQVDTPAALYAHPADASVFGFLGDSLAFACTVADGLARFANGLPPVATACPDGPAVAMVRPYQLGLSPDPDGPARITAVHDVGGRHRVDVTLGGEVMEISIRGEDAIPPAGCLCTLDLSQAAIYPTGRAA